MICSNSDFFEKILKNEKFIDITNLARLLDTKTRTENFVHFQKFCHNQAIYHREYAQGICNSMVLMKNGFIPNFHI